jgi:hypothetical protein
MRRSLSTVVVAGAVATAAPSASAATITIDGHFKDAFPKSGPTAGCFIGGPGGKGMLRGFGEACELFTFESFDSDVGDNCALITATDTITLNDAQQSSFTEREHDLICNVGASGQTPGHLSSYGNPARWTGTWALAA